MYLFYLEGVLLPVTPSKVTTKVGNNNKTIELINQGEINLIKFPKLTEYSFEFELPFKKFAWSNRECDPKEILDLLEAAKQNKKVLTFNIIRKMKNQTRFPTSQEVTVEDYEVEEDSENNSDMTVTINLKMFKPYRTIHLISKKEEVKRVDSVKKKEGKKSSTSCLKKIELLSDLNVRSGAGTQNRKLAIMRQGDKPCVYGEYKVGGTTWYKIKHSAGDKDKEGTAWGWISGNTQYTKVIKDFLSPTWTTQDVIGQKGHYRK